MTTISQWYFVCLLPRTSCGRAAVLLGISNQFHVADLRIEEDASWSGCCLAVINGRTVQPRLVRKV